MPVEERIRSALAELAAQVRVDAEQPLEGVRRRRQRRLTTLWAGAGAAVVALVAAAVVLVPQPAQRPEPAGPPAGETDRCTAADDPPGDVRPQVTVEEALEAGFPREVVADLFGGAGGRGSRWCSAQDVRASEQERLGPLVRRRPGRSAGSVTRGYYYPTGVELLRADGGWTSSAGGSTATGFDYDFSWELEAGSLVLEPIPKTHDASRWPRSSTAAPGSGSGS